MTNKSAKQIYLGVNIDHVATLRQARLTTYPSPLMAGKIAQDAGADSITVHLREDRRHIQEDDVIALKQELTIPLNLEMAMTDEMVEIATRIRPAYCCIVPEKRQELTTEGGLDVLQQQERCTAVCAKLTAVGIKVSLFIDALKEQIDAARLCGAPVIEIHTGQYADAVDKNDMQREFQKVLGAANYAASIGLQVNAGHGLNYDNVRKIAEIDVIEELNIGHSIIARSVFDGLTLAVREMKTMMQDCRS